MDIKKRGKYGMVMPLLEVFRPNVIKSLKKFMLIALFFILGFLLGCSSSPPALSDSLSPPSSVLSPVEEGNQVSSQRSSEAYQKLSSQLQALGYEPLGMQFEEEKTLELLVQVFNDPQTHKRDLKLVYTGLRMDFDKVHRSLTIGGLTEVTPIVAFIVKHVPLKKSEIPPPATPRVFPKSSAKPMPKTRAGMKKKVPLKKGKLVPIGKPVGTPVTPPLVTPAPVAPSAKKEKPLLEKVAPVLPSPEPEIRPEPVSPLEEPAPLIPESADTPNSPPTDTPSEVPIEPEPTVETPQDVPIEN